MAKATKLPSGNWRVRVYIGKDPTGKAMYRSFTDPDRKKVLFEASLYQIEHREERTRMTFKKAMDEYISSKEMILSPSTVRTYRTTQNTLLSEYSAFCEIELDKMKRENVQELINSISAKRQPKTVRNYSGFINAILDFKDIALGKWTLPQKKRPTLNIPTEDIVRHTLELAKGTELYIPILLAVCCTMRRGEICGLHMEDIKGNTIHVHKSIVRGVDGKYHEKAPKTYSSDRYIECPEFIIKSIRSQGYVTKLSPNKITERFRLLLLKGNIKPYRFHDLRHYSASILHAMNIPDSYIMQRGGWSTDSTLKSVYRHTFEKQSKEEARKANEYFSALSDDLD